MTDAATEMIDAAERIAAEQGIAAMTVRAVQAAAGQRNKSAVQYHFGGRAGLVEAVFERRMGPNRERRTAMLLALGEKATIRDLVEILVLPMVETVREHTPSYWARFSLQAANDPSIGAVGLSLFEGETMVAIHRRLRELLPHLSDGIYEARFYSVLGYVLVCLAAYESGTVPRALDEDGLVTELVDACCGLLQAPSTVTTNT